LAEPGWTPGQARVFIAGHGVASASDPIDEQVLDALRQLQGEGRPDIVRQVIRLFFKGAVDLLRDLENGAATGDARCFTAPVTR